MRFIAGLISIFVVVWADAAWAGPPLPPMVDPIFKLTLPSSLYTKGLSETPQTLIRLCGLNVSPHYAYRDWTLASVIAPSGHYLLLAGALRHTASTPASPWKSDPNGAFVRVTEKKCTAIDPAAGVFAAADSYGSDPTLRIPISVFQDLASDAVRRYAHAFGSYRKFIKVLRQQHRYPEGRDDAILSDALSDRGAR